MAVKPYCDRRSDRGLTCSPDSLVLLRRLSEDEGPTWKNIIFLYQCTVCQGHYKYIYSSGYQTRNFDSDEGWYEYSDHYFKVGERNAAGTIQFPVEEARIYGFEGEVPT